MKGKSTIVLSTIMALLMVVSTFTVGTMNVKANSNYYTLNIDVEGNGVVVKNPNYVTYLEGTVVDLNAIPDPGWRFDHWSGDLSGSNNPETITMDDCKAVTAYFEEGLDVTKTVWNGTDWVDEIHADMQDTVRFKITVAYTTPIDPVKGYRATDILINDTLPNCLDYADDAKITYGTETFIGESWINGKEIWWNLTEDYATTYNTYSGNLELYLDDCTAPNTVSIEFNATVVDCGINVNIVEVDATEHCSDLPLYGDDDATVIVNEPTPPAISVIKSVREYQYGEYDDEGITVSHWHWVEFKLNVTNTGGVGLVNVTVCDVLPDGLTYLGASQTPDFVDGNVYYWNFSSLAVGETVIITFYAKADGFGEVTNVVTATGEYDEGIVEDDDDTTVLIRGLEVEKTVEYNGEWVKTRPEVTKGEHVQFKIDVTYHGDENPDHLMDCGYVADYLPEGCLDYIQTMSVKVNGVLLDPESNEYPYIIPDSGDILTTCFGEVNITEWLESNNCPVQGSDIIIWDFTGSWWFELHDGDTIEIIFETNVTHYCDACPDCTVTNYAAALMWNCHPCIHFFGFDYAEVSCCPPDTTFSKKVWDAETDKWVEVATVVVDETATFKLEFTYYGNEDLDEIHILDVLPCVLEYESANIEPTYVSGDKKTIWWNISGTITDGDTITIIFDALVTGQTGDCPACNVAINHATLYTYIDTGVCEPILVLIDQFTDTAGIIATENHAPCPPIIRDYENGVEGDEISIDVQGYDADEDDMYFMIDWGDGTSLVWDDDLYANGEIATFTHVFEEKGNYEVRAKAKDVNGKISPEWGNTVTIEVTEEPVPPASSLKICFAAFNYGSIGATLKNENTGALSGVEWNMSVNGGLLGRVDAYNNGTETIGAGNSTSICSGALQFGLGKVNIVAKAVAPGEDPIKAEATGFIIGKIVIIL